MDPRQVMQVAAECGFISTQHFSKRYREQYGVPPKDERVHRRRMNSPPLH